MLGTPAHRWILSLAAFRTFSIDDLAPVTDPERRAAADHVLVDLWPDFREGLVRDIAHTLATGRPWETSQLIIRLTAAVQAGRMPPGEAWPILHHTARLMQQTFSSWDDYGAALIIDFDGVTDGRNDCRRDVAALLRPPGVWTRLPWDLDLEPGATPPAATTTVGETDR